MKLTEDELNQHVHKVLTDQHLYPLLKAVYFIYDEPNDSPEYEAWESAYEEITLWLQTQYFHRFDPVELQVAMNYCLDNKLFNTK